MSVYNSDAYLREAMLSILNQTFTNFELIIFNDASTDQSKNIIESFNDTRIVLINNKSNLGLTKNLNRGISIAKGEFIARMDADDLSHLERFSKQLEFLKKNSNVSICGTQINVLGKMNQISNYPLNHNEIKIALLSTNPLAHPTVMWRKMDFYENGFKYDEEYTTSQDYELWSRVLYKLKAANINESLLQYRIHDKQVSIKQSNNQIDNAIKIKVAQLNFLNILPTKEEVEYHLCMFDNQFLNKRDSYTLQKADEWMCKLYLRNKDLKIFDNELFLNIWQQRFFGKGLYEYNMSIWVVLKNSYCKKYCKITTRIYFKQLVKCILNWSIK